jgi:hypothetical protein
MGHPDPQQRVLYFPRVLARRADKRYKRAWWKRRQMGNDLRVRRLHHQAQNFSFATHDLLDLREMEESGREDVEILRQRLSPTAKL